MTRSAAFRSARATPRATCGAAPPSGSSAASQTRAPPTSAASPSSPTTNGERDPREKPPRARRGERERGVGFPAALWTQILSKLWLFFEKGTAAGKRGAFESEERAREFAASFQRASWSKELSARARGRRLQKEYQRLASRGDTSVDSPASVLLATRRKIRWIWHVFKTSRGVGPTTGVSR